MFYTDPSFVVGAAFIIVVAWLAKPIMRAVSSALDGRADKIRGQIEEARKLREEAQALLAEYQRKQRDALSEAEHIVAQAKEEATRMRAQAEQDLEKSVERRKAQALDRIAQSEAQAIASVRNTAVDVAIAAAQKLITDQMSGDRQDALVDSAIKDLGNRLN
ncbi:MAG: F0F1 ATP synthase subunit B [Rhodospirillaceae bacterium]|jgi:F-type H+-transporting ATPase subunit b|nr:F0F1 ATP synthase subunit B [Rhodospirillaceae bacterium]MBT5241224.1 F0F1 ATP synthase subunit B [Rhodospirillaceae bacterium]MBT5565141.1 F0F1 ATP synthase subunit B [Rhodospirillaceae bacterium]MBT6088163.1 F0F1 ATP synthase subunit B [Rhodospirillaceae bacterium]MBT6962246.1 F0F1 ATP synthase subunit B [Rhodospirillaceae bacterium]